MRQRLHFARLQLPIPFECQRESLGITGNRGCKSGIA
jgi:hypothetical protein